MERTFDVHQKGFRLTVFGAALVAAVLLMWSVASRAEANHCPSQGVLCTWTEPNWPSGGDHLIWSASWAGNWQYFYTRSARNRFDNRAVYFSPSGCLNPGFSASWAEVRPYFYIGGLGSRC